MTVKITKTTQMTLYGSSTLAELRQFVAACEGLPGSAIVSVSVDRGHGQLDRDSATLTVNDAA